MNTDLTTEPITAASVHDPEFVDVRDLRERFGIKRSLGYAAKGWKDSRRFTQAKRSSAASVYSTARAFGNF
jgi:hypothetical protein